MSTRKASARWFVLLGFFIALAGCSRSGDVANDPKARLNEYISRTFSIRDVGEKQVLMSYLTGDARRRLEAWSDDQFREAFIDSKREFVKLAFKESKEISPQEVHVTYELSYMDAGKSAGRKITNKKLCQMSLEQGKWMIKDVKNIKELVEYKNEMSLP